MNKSSYKNVFLSFQFFTLLNFLVVTYRGVFKTQLTNYHEVFCENSKRVLAVNYFCIKKAPRRGSIGLKIRFWLT